MPPIPSGAHPRRGPPALAALIALTALVYLDSLFGPFQFDDFAVVATDRAAQGWAAWRETLAQRIRPLLKATYVATHQLGGWLGHATLGHHLGGLLIHLVVVALSWRLALVLATSFRMAPDIAGRAALGCAAVVALHPLATEAVTYITGRSVALGTLFALAAALAQVQAGGATVARARNLAWRAAALAAFAAALLSRETFILLPALLMLLEWGRGDGQESAFSIARLRLALRRTSALWAVAAVAVVAMLGHRRYGPLLELSAVIAQGRLDSPSMLLALEYFATRLLLLSPLSIDPAIQPEHLGVAHRAVASLVAAAALLLAWRCRKSRPWWIIASVWAVLTLAPVYLVPIRHDGVAERHFYPVLWGVGFAVSCEFAVRLRRAMAVAAGCAAALVLSAATVMRNAEYSTEVALWEAAARDSHATPRALNNLGVAYVGERRWDEARAAFERALALDPGYAKARGNRDRALAGQRTGDPFAEPEI
jgi:tetratricopeptide (TPR) repeat protein